MSNKSTEIYYHYHQQHFLYFLYVKYNHPPLKCSYNHHGERGKSRMCGGSSSIFWILCSLFIKLLCTNTSIAAVAPPPLNSISSATLVVKSTIDASTSKAVSTVKSFTENNKLTVSELSHHSTLPEVEKEVVERLVKDWAAIVWLAPEEKFMPLGVDEFLAHVHPESKDNSFTPGLSFQDSSEKSFLVTNTEIEKLLENGTSFIYGRNPNVSPVPIYAVVTLCNQAINEEETLASKQTIRQKLPSLQTTYSPPSLYPVIQHGFLPSALEITNPTRSPYIPITFGPQNHIDNNLRRSSRLYPMFHKTKRSIKNMRNTGSFSLHEYNLGKEESVESFSVDRLPTFDSKRSDVKDESEDVKVNNFIANLVDNVKFSVPFNEKDNVLEKENGQQMPGYVYMKGTAIPSFHVTYWMFYPYSQGKNMCTLSLGPFGSIPFPAVYGFCLGRKIDIGSHIGDWEHMTLYFTGSTEPEAMYVSAHDAGAYYAYNRLTGSFEFKRQETRRGILQRPNFPKTVTTFNNHPVLFAAKGSHGLWTAPGKHRFVKVARLYDINGFGTPWNTWKHIQITYENLKSYGRAFVPSWLSFKGKWGNPKSKCHPLRRIGLNFCEFTDGPTGIPLKEPHFQCGNAFRR